MESPRKSMLSSIFDLTPMSVDDSLKGWVEANNGLVLLEGHRVVLRRDYRMLNQVKILSGGWSGYEPMYTGFVGPGMLTGAVVGDRSASPPFPSILAAIRELAAGNPHGVLIILMNHPTNNINFMLAVEIAARENIPVKLVFVTDDCSGKVYKHGRKGLAGVALIFKVASAMADQKRTMEEICNVCGDVCSINLATISVNVKTNHQEAALRSLEDLCSMNGSRSINSNNESSMKVIQVQQDLAEVRQSASAIHPFASVSDLAKTLLEYTVFGTLSPHSILHNDTDPVVVLINNYGFMLNLELNALAHNIIIQLRSKRIKAERVYIGSLIESRVMGGFSVTVMKVNQGILECLDHPVTAPGWPTNVLYKGESHINLPLSIKAQWHFSEEPKKLGPFLEQRDAERVRRALEYVFMALTSCETQLNKMDTDHGFYGSQVREVTEVVNNALFSGTLQVSCPYALFSKLSEIFSTSLRNFTGSIYAVFFDGAAQAFLRYVHDVHIKPCMWIEALENGIKAIEYYFELKRGDRNMLDAFYPMLEAMQKSPKSYIQIAEAAELGSLRTLNPDVKAHATPDLSTHVVSLWARAAAEGLISIESKSYPEPSSDDYIASSDDEVVLL